MSGKDRVYRQPEALNADDAVQEAAGIVVWSLAAADPLFGPAYTLGDRECRYCLRFMPPAAVGLAVMHAPDCAWVQVRRLVGRPV